MRLILFLLLLASPAAAERCVVLLHGLARTETSFLLMEEALEAEGWRVVRPGYPSTMATVETLTRQTLPDAVAQCGTPKVDFVTHSMGGILLRHWAAQNGAERVGRVVMLAPPNQGSEVVDAFRDVPAFDWLNGPAGTQMATDGLPSHLPPLNFEAGVIAGARSLNPFFSAILPGQDDGKVSVQATVVEGMKDHIVLPVTHTFLMNNARVIAQVVEFLRNGRFDPSMSYADAVLNRMGCEDVSCFWVDDD